MLLLCASLASLKEDSIFKHEHGEYDVSNIFFVFMTVKHELTFMDSAEQAIDKNSHICSILLLRTNNLLSQLLDSKTIHKNDIHNYLINFRNELPKLSELFGGSGLLPVEF